MPWKIYGDDPHWVPPVISDQKSVLNPEKGPFFEHGEAELFLAYEDGKPVGRLSAHINRRHDAIYGDEKGFLGFFECVDNAAVASKLFDHAAEYLRTRNRTRMEGPYSFSIYDEIGIQLDGFEQVPYVLTAHTRPYYRELFERNGFSKSIDWYAFRVDASKPNTAMHQRYDRIRSRIEKLGRLDLRQMDRGKNFARDAEIVKKIFSDAWEKNWGHVPMSDSEFERVAEFIRLIVCPELSLIAEVDGQPVGCS
ncbi:MAG: GNAT family N-acetyltransferase, partial [Planctomycetota bacterium]